MDELEILKQDWKKQEGNYPQLSYDQIYKMLWKKSSSIVKWIFVISIIEFLFWAVLSLFLADKDYWNTINTLDLKRVVIWEYIISYGITFFFIFKFYTNYKKISTTDNVSKLMENILKTRKTVKLYIAFVLISTAISVLIFTYFSLNYHSINTEVEELSKYTFSIKQWIIFLGAMAIIIAVLLGMVWLFYRLLYGILLKKLNKNYKELKKLNM